MFSFARKGEEIQSSAIERNKNESANPNSLRIQSIAEQAPWMSEEHIKKIADAHRNQGKRGYIYENTRARMLNLPSQTGKYIILPDIPPPPPSGEERGRNLS